MARIQAAMPALNSKITLFTLLSFLSLGLPRVVTTAAATALFLQAFGAEMLPVTYVIAAFLAPAVNAGYLWLQRRISFWSLLLLALALDCAVLFLAWVGIRAEFGRGYVMLAMVWVEVQWMLVDLVFWGLAGRMFTIREGKAVFGRIGAGEPVAVILGGLSIPLVLAVTGTADLLLVSVGAMLGSAMLIVALRACHRGDLQNADEEPEAQPDFANPVGGARIRGKLRRFLSFGSHSRYVHLIFAATFLTQITHFVIDTAFASVSERAFPDEAALASFLALFMAVTGVVNLIFNLFISRQVMRRFGVGAALWSLPLLNGIAGVAAISTGLLPPEIGAFFIAVALLKLIDEALRSGLYMPAMQTVYQPLPPEARTRAHAFNGGYVEQIAGGLGGLGLLVLTTLVGVGAQGLVVAALLLCGGWFLLARKLSSRYAATLSDAFGRRRNSSDLAAQDPEKAREWARKSIHSQRPGEAIYALALIERTGTREDLSVAVSRLAGHASPQARRAAMTCVARLHLESARETMLTLLEHERDDKVRAAGVRALASLDGEQAIEWLIRALDEPSEDVQVAAFAGLMLDCGIEGTLACGGRFVALHRSGDRKQRLIAARVLDEIASPHSYRLILENLAAEESPVRRLAFRAAGKSRAHQVIPALFSALASPANGAGAAAALVPFGDVVLDKAFARFDENCACASEKARLLGVIGHVGGKRATDWLLARTSSGSLEDRLEVARALDAAGFAATDESVWEHIQDSAAWLRQSQRPIPEGHGPLFDALRAWQSQRYRRQRERLFLLLGCVLPRDRIQRASRRLLDGSETERAYALEMIDSLLPFRQKARLLPAIDPEQSGVTEQLPALPLCELASNPDGLYGAPTQAVALLAYAETGQRLAPDALLDLLFHTAPLVAETARLVAIQNGLVEPHEEMPGMSIIEKIILLGSVELFSEVPERVLADIAAATTEHELEEGQWLIREGDVGDRLYVIVDGEVEVATGETVLARLGAGDVVGEMAALDLGGRAASVRAIGAGVALSLDHDHLEDLMAGNVELTQGFLRMLSSRLRDANRRIRDAEQVAAKVTVAI